MEMEGRIVPLEGPVAYSHVTLLPWTNSGGHHAWASQGRPVILNAVEKWRAMVEGQDAISSSRAQP